MADETLAYVANYHPPVGHLIHQTATKTVRDGRSMPCTVRNPRRCSVQ